MVFSFQSLLALRMAVHLPAHPLWDSPSAPTRWHPEPPDRQPVCVKPPQSPLRISFLPRYPLIRAAGRLRWRLRAFPRLPLLSLADALVLFFPIPFFPFTIACHEVLRSLFLSSSYEQAYLNFLRRCGIKLVYCLSCVCYDWARIL